MPVPACLQAAHPAGLLIICLGCIKCSRKSRLGNRRYGPVWGAAGCALQIVTGYHEVLNGMRDGAMQSIR